MGTSEHWTILEGNKAAPLPRETLINVLIILALIATQNQLDLRARTHFTGILVNSLLQGKMKFVYLIFYYISTMAQRFVFHTLKQELGSGILAAQK